MTKNLIIGLFLGAGASVPFGKPTTKKLKERLIARYSWERGFTPHPTQYTLHSVLSFDEFEDIEHVLQSLKEIDNFFINSRYGGRYLLGREPQFTSDPGRPWLLKEFLQLITLLRKTIEDEVFESYSWDHSKDKILGQIYDQLFEMIKKYSKDDIKIFTTNYDRAIEEYCSNPSRKCQCIDGFEYDSHSRRNRWVGNYTPSIGGETNVYLYKLHGSLNWKKHKTGKIVATGEERRSNDPNYTDHLLVFPTVSPKDGQESEPYKTIRKYFKEFMKTAHVCIAVGFSFRDTHVNSIFSGFLKRGGILVVVSPSADRNISGNFFKKPLPRPTSVSWSQDRSIKLYEKDGLLITINEGLTSKNSGRIAKYLEAAIQGLSVDNPFEK